MSIRKKAISGVLWNSISNFSSFGIDFIVGLILARLLTPKDFGLIATIIVVIALSEVFINSGFNQAIIRKQNCTQKDYSTAFFFNFIVAVFFFIILLITAKPISIFFNNTELKPLIQVLAFGLIISSFTLIQQAKLTKRIDFKLQTKISLISSTTSGCIGIVLALTGFGVWSLVVRSLTHKGIQSSLLWLWNRWKPDLVFSFDSFKELFGFGSKLLVSGLVGTLLQNINYIIIAKYFTPQELGYFTRAEMLKNLPSQNISSIITTVGYPVLATLQDDPVKMKKTFRYMLVNTFFIISILMAGMAATAKPLILTLIGHQWLPSVILLQMLAFLGVMVPLNSMNINILNVVGRSDLYMKLQFVVQALAIPNIFVGVFFGIKALIVGMIVISLVGYVIFNHESYKVLNYSIREQIKDVLPSSILACFMGLIVFMVGYMSDYHHSITLMIQIITGMLIITSAGELLKLKEYIFFKGIFLDKVQMFLKK